MHADINVTNYILEPMVMRKEREKKVREISFILSEWQGQGKGKEKEIKMTESKKRKKIRNVHDGAAQLVSAVDKGLAHLHLETEATVLGIELVLRLGLDLLDIILKTPLEGLQDHGQSVGDVPLAGTEETEQQRIYSAQQIIDFCICLLALIVCLFCLFVFAL